MHSAIELKCMDRLPSCWSQRITAFSGSSFQAFNCRAGLNVMSQFEIAAATPLREAREKYLLVEMRKLYSFAQKRLTASAPE
jgi:hypothetical protein